MGTKTVKKKNIPEIISILEKMYPDARCELNFNNPFELIIAVVLSAQTTDVGVNKVTPALFEKYPDAETLSNANPDDVAEIISTIGLYRNKSRNIVNLAKMLCDKHEGIVPSDYEALVELPGVGRKTANVVLAEAFGEQRIAVDTHVFRVANRIGLVDEKDVLATEESLMKRLPKDKWTKSHHLIIIHGRRCCNARKPQCESCGIKDYCVYYNNSLY